MTLYKKTRIRNFLLSHFHMAFLAVGCTILAAASCGCDSVPISGMGAAGSTDGAANEAPGMAAPDPLAELGADAADPITRAIEESDIIKVVDDTLYALNRFKGLLVIDVSDPDDPTLAGSLDLKGRGVEMYVVGNQAYVLLSADFYYPYLMEGGMPGAAPAMMMDGPLPPMPDFNGSQLAIVDVTDPTNPDLLDKLNLVGYASESRRVGDVIYVVGANHMPFRFRSPDEPDAADGFVASVNVADPDNIIPVERVTFAGHALTMHVSQTAIFAASQEYDPQGAGSYTEVQVIDIADAGGAIDVRGTFNVPGHIRNRFYMDAHEDVLRVATESWGFGFTSVRLFTYDLADLDDVQPLGQTEIIQGETLEAVRFDGPRGYVVTFLRVDPLFVLDLSDPADPRVTGELKVPGFSTHIEPRGERLIAVGIDDTNGRRPAVSYYDVSDPDNPTELGRVVLGPPGSFTESQATYDEKAFKVVDEIGLIAIPFRHADYDPWLALPGASLDDPIGNGGADLLPDPETYRPVCVNGVQLVDFDDDGLSQRGWFEHRGHVQRVGVIGDRVFALSQVGLQTVDISDRDHPAKAGQADFFEPDELPYYADDCGGFYGPVIRMPGGVPSSLLLLLDFLLEGDVCGMMGTLPLMAVPVGLGFAKARRRRRRP